MHSANIVHRDLKPANILVNENVSAKICDFGLARGFTENDAIPKPKSHKKFQLNKKFNLPKAKPNSKAKSRDFERQLTKHVVTRWYRAPEVILFSQRREYLSAIDMWSVGCILSELLMMVPATTKNANISQFQHYREPLFPGKSCFPLSATDPEAYKDSRDQLNCIFSVIGTPSHEEILKIADEQAKQYLLKLSTNNYQTGINFYKRFAWMFRRNPLEPEVENPRKSVQSHDQQHEYEENFYAIDLLQKLLQFDVEKRITVDQALLHPFFNDVRDFDAEKRHQKEIFSFEDVPLKMETIYELIVDEVCYYNPELLALHGKEKDKEREKQLKVEDKGVSNGQDLGDHKSDPGDDMVNID